MLRLSAALGVLVLFAAGSSASQSQSSPSASRPPVAAKPSLPEAGAISGGVYRNSTFRFSYKLPYGWVDRTADMQDDAPDAGKSRLLLAIFERPPEATGDTINSAVVIAAEPLTAYPGVKTAAEYFESLSELTTSKGFQAAGDPGEISVGATRLTRGDFSRARGTLTMYQTSLAVLDKGYAVSFTFVGGSEDEINELIEKLSFAARKAAR